MERVTRKNKRIVFNLPRFGGKSTFQGTVLPAWRIGRDPFHESIGLVTHTKTYSEDFVRTVRKIILDSEAYHRVFGKIPLEINELSKIVVAGKEEPRVPTMEGFGVGQAITGRHPRIWLLDDLVDHGQILAGETRKKTRQICDWIDTVLLPAVSEDQSVFVVGTRWGKDDVYGYLEGKPGWKIVRIEAIGTEKTPLGRKYLDQSYWEDVWPLPSLLSKKAEVGTAAWMTQYQNDPALTEGVEVQTANLQYYDELPVEKSQLRVIMGVDPALSEKDVEGNSYFAISVIGVAGDGKIYLLWTYRRRVRAREQFTQITAAYSAWEPERIFIEKVGHNDYLRQFLLKKSLPVFPTTQTHDKTARIRAGLIPFIENGLFQIKRNNADFLEELLEFPAGHIDLLDATEMAVRGSKEQSGSTGLPITITDSTVEDDEITWLKS